MVLNFIGRLRNMRRAMNVSSASLCDKFLKHYLDEAGNSKGVRMIGYIGEETLQRKLPVLYEDSGAMLIVKTN